MTQWEDGRKVCSLEFVGKPALKGGGYGDAIILEQSFNEFLIAIPQEDLK